MCSFDRHKLNAGIFVVTFPQIKTEIHQKGFLKDNKTDCQNAYKNFKSNMLSNQIK